MTTLFRRLTLLPAVAALLALTGITVAAGFGGVPTDLHPVKGRLAAPDFALIDANGGPIKLSGYKGRVVLLDFWATWCTGCKVEIPWYMAFQRKYARQGLTSIGAAMDDEGWQKVKPYLSAHPINYPIVLGNPDLVKPYTVTSLPVTLLIDREGRIADTHVGIVVREIWEKEIRSLLNERPGRVPSLAP